MNEEDNIHVDNVVNNMVSDDINTISDVETIEPSKDLIESPSKAGRPPHLPNADTRNKVYTLSTSLITLFNSERIHLSMRVKSLERVVTLKFDACA